MSLLEQADNQLIATLKQSIDGMTKIQERLPTLARECADQHGSLDIFYINNIMDFEYDIKDLDWEHRKWLGGGSFAEVYKTEMKRKKRTVALKVDALSEYV